MAFYLDCFLPVEGQALEKALEINHIMVQRFASQIDFKQNIKPHLTLFMGFFPEINPVQKELLDLNQSFAGFDVHLQGFRLTSEGYLFWDAEEQEELQLLHEKVLESLNPLRNGLIREKFNQSFDSYLPVEQENIKKFGFPWVKHLFNPHLTLAKISEPVNRVEILDALKHLCEKSSFSVKCIMLGRVGENGTVLNSD
ncbi:MAG: 2'-5' RNA ligase family protein [Candidatus Riflebacteria bacterium]